MRRGAGVGVLLVMACEAAPTEVMVRVDSDIPTTRDQGPLRRIQIHVARVGDPFTAAEPVEFLGTTLSLPGDHLVRLTNPDDARALSIRVTAEQSSGPPLEQRYVVQPTRGARKLLRVFLAERCRARCDDQGMHCTGGVTCPPGAHCGATECSPDASPLQDFTPLGQEDAAAARVGQACATGATRPCYAGTPQTRGRGRCRDGTQSCDLTGRWNSACVGQVLPSAGDGDAGDETDCNGLDDDCDGETDEGCGCQPGAVDATPCYEGPAATRDRGVCRAGGRACGSDMRWGPCQGQVLPAAESCNGYDDDCDGLVDEGLGTRACTAAGLTAEVPRCFDGRQPECPPASCDGRQCGRDIRGAECGTCPDGATCMTGGRCVVPQCDGRHCGVDRNGQRCGSCPSGEECHPTAGRCVSTLCGSLGLTVPCGRWNCPVRSTCGTQLGVCVCDPTTVAVTCAGALVGGASVFPTELSCSRGAAFCGRGAVRCPAGGACPLHATCVTSPMPGCQCEAGYHPTRCSGPRCSGRCPGGATCCPGADYYCAPDSA